MSTTATVPTTVFAARRILTMNPSCPSATHVAVREGRIVGVGSLADMHAYGPHTLDAQFADKVLMPGLIEAHSHLMAGGLWRFRYCGFFAARDPEGHLWPGAQTLEAVIAQLREAAQHTTDGDATGPVAGWGFDPIYFGARRCHRSDLDQVSATRPVGVLHASGHILNVNTAALQAAGLMRTGIDHPAFVLGDDGLPTGELRGPEAMMPVLPHVGFSHSFLSADVQGMQAFAKLCVHAGVTTATDMAATLSDAEVNALRQVTGDPLYPVRLVPLLRLIGMTAQQALARAVQLREQQSEQLRLGRIKVVADGSIQGFSARLRWPHYHNGAPNGLWYTPPETIRACYTEALRHGLQVHTHTNGDEATDMALDCMAAALAEVPRWDHRFTLQHVQLADAAQFRRMHALGVGVNLFANHTYYWGDQHHDVTVGPERAARMNACASALREGVAMTIHSDAPITPLGPLFTAWCAVQRQTASGRVLGEHERISVAQALHAITVGAAYSLGLDAEIGTIQAGKRADFCVLEDDPTQVPAAALKDVGVWGTVQGGRVFAAHA